MVKRISTVFIALFVFVSMFYTAIPSKAFTEEDAYAYSALAMSVGMRNKDEVIDISAYMLSADFAEQLYYDVILSDASLYFVKLNYTDTTCTLSEDGEYIDSYKIEYYFIETDVTDAIFKKHLDRAISEIPVVGMHTVDQMLAIHEYIANNVDKEESLEEVTDEHLCSTAYGALVYGCADSLGYALLNMALAEAVTENDCIVVSDAGKTEYWNMYLLNGNWYNIDVYSDDIEVYYVDGNQNVTDTYVIGSMRNHIYFLETTTIINMYGHTSPVAYTYGGTPVSETDTVRIRIWNNITSPMFYYDGYWYYVSPSSPDVLVKRLTNVAAIASSEETVFMADGNIISFALTYDSIFYAIDTGRVKQLPLVSLERNDDYETDGETGSGEEPEQGTENEQPLTEIDIYTVASDSEIIVGMGNRDDRIYYELYNTADGSYSFYMTGAFCESLELPSVDENMIISGIDGNSRVWDLFDIISKIGFVNRYDAYNSLSVISDEKELNLVQFLCTGSKLVLPDGTEYTIVVRGDVIPGSNINIIDVLSVMNYINGTVTEFTDIQVLAMDYDGADGVNVADVALIYKAMFNVDTVKDTDTKFAITVNKGFSKIDGVTVNEASHGTKINIVADIPEGMVFDKWIVVSGDVNILNVKSASTYFMMPYKNVEVTATFKAASVTIDNITFENVSERYSETEAKVISFTNTGEVVLTNPFVSLRSGSEYFDLITYSLPYYIESGATNNTSYAIQPKLFLPYGTYTAEIVLTANELKTEASIIISFTVEHICCGTSIAGKIADCTEDGWLNYYKCSCGKYFTDETVSVEISDLEAWKTGEGKIPAYGHICGLLIERVEPVHTETELTDGMEAHYFCYICGEYLDEEKVVTSKEALVIPAPAHTHSRYDSDDLYHWSVCECGAVVDGPSEEHSFGEDGTGTICYDCGYERIVDDLVTDPIE